MIITFIVGVFLMMLYAVVAIESIVGLAWLGYFIIRRIVRKVRERRTK